MRNHWLEILVLGDDVKMRVRAALHGLPEVIGQGQVERVVPGGAHLDQLDLACQPTDLLDERQIELLLVLPDQ